MSGPGRAGQMLLAFLLGAGVVAAIWAWESKDPLAPQATPQAVPRTPPPTDRSADTPSDPGLEEVKTPPPEEVRPTPDDPEPGITAIRYRCVLPEGIAADAEVSAWWREDAESVFRCHPSTLEEGFLTIQVPPGRGEVSFHVRGCLVVESDVEVRSGRVLDGGELVLAPCTPLSGRVLNADGMPIEDAFLYPDVDGHSVPLTGTGEDGSFEFDGLPDGNAVLRVECDGYVRRTVRFVHTEGAEPIEIVLNRGGQVSGRVFDEQGQPLSDAYLWIEDTEDKENRERMAWPSVEDDGSFSVNLSAGRYDLHGLEGERSGSASLRVVDGGTIEVKLWLVPR